MDEKNITAVSGNPSTRSALPTIFLFSLFQRSATFLHSPFAWPGINLLMISQAKGDDPSLAVKAQNGALPQLFVALIIIRAVYELMTWPDTPLLGRDCCLWEVLVGEVTRQVFSVLLRVFL